VFKVCPPHSAICGCKPPRGVVGPRIGEILTEKARCSETCVSHARQGGATDNLNRDKVYLEAGNMAMRSPRKDPTQRSLPIGIATVPDAKDSVFG
jgi:hypothetical protein